MHPFIRLAVAIALASTLPVGMRAQTVTGTVRDSVTALPVRGVFLELADTGGRRVAATLTDSAGRFLLKAEPGRYTLGVGALGYQESSAAALELLQGAESRLALQLTPAPIPLAALGTVAAPRCKLRRDTTGAVLAAWTEARRALRLADWSMRESGLVMVTRTYREIGPIRTRLVIDTIYGRPPFEPLPVDRARTTGLFWSHADTASFFAPGPEYVLSDEFLESHCFSLRKRGGRLGLDFVPVSREEGAVSGTLWLGKDGALQQIELSFRKVSRPVRVSGAEGKLDFARTMDGRYIVFRWYIRVFGFSRGGATFATGRGGDVIKSWLRAEGDASGGGARARQGPPIPGRVTVAGVVLDSLTGGPVSGATVSLAAAHRVVFTDTQGAFFVDAVPVPAEQIQVRQLGYATVSFATRIRPEVAPLLIYLTPDPVPLQAITARADRNQLYTIEGTVVDSATGRPLPNVVVWFRTSGGRAVTDTLGHYVFDAAHPGSEDILVDVVGYRRTTASRRIAQPWERLDFALPPNPFELQAIVAFGQRRPESVHAQGFSRVLTERELAASGLSSGHDFLRWAQALSPPVGIVCDPSQISATSGQVVHRAPRAELGQLWIPPPLKPTTIVNGQWLGGFSVDGGWVSVEDFNMQPGEFYQAIVRRSFGCLGVNRRAFVTVTVYSKAYMRKMAGRTGGLKPIPFDSLEALMARADSLR